MSLKNLKKYRKYVQDGAWTVDRVDKLLEAGKITQEEYEYILGGE